MVIGPDDEPGFVASDVAKVLGYRDAEKMTGIWTLKIVLHILCVEPLEAKAAIQTCQL